MRPDRCLRDTLHEEHALREFIGNTGGHAGIARLWVQWQARVPRIDLPRRGDYSLRGEIGSEGIHAGSYGKPVCPGRGVRPFFHRGVLRPTDGVLVRFRCLPGEPQR